MRPPSLYAHIGGLEDLRRRIGTRAARPSSARSWRRRGRGRARGDALRAIAGAYRAYAHAHPGSYAALQRLTDQRDEAVVAAAMAPVGVVVAVLRGYGIEGDDAIHATRVVRAALHGFVSLEADTGFGIPIPVDESFERLVAVLDGGLAAAAW